MLRAQCPPNPKLDILIPARDRTTASQITTLVRVHKLFLRTIEIWKRIRYFVKAINRCFQFLNQSFARERAEIVADAEQRLNRNRTSLPNVARTRSRNDNASAARFLKCLARRSQGPYLKLARSCDSRE